MSAATAVVANDESSTGPTVERDLPCQLSPEELQARGDSMAVAELQITKIKDERLTLNRAIRELAERRAELASIIESKTEPRAVSCTWHRDNEALTWILARNDTGEVVEQRPQTAHERQGKLFDEGAGEGHGPEGELDPEALPPIDDDPVGDDDDDAPDAPVPARKRAARLVGVKRKAKPAAKGKSKGKRARRS